MDKGAFIYSLEPPISGGSLEPTSKTLHAGVMWVVGWVANRKD